MGLIRFLLAAALSTGVAAPTSTPSISPIAAVPSDGQVLLAYEIRLPRGSSVPQELILLDADKDRVVARFDTGQLLQRIAETPDGGRLIYIEASVPPQAAPARLAHHLRWPDDTQTRLTPQPVDRRAPVLTPPFSDGLWVAVHSPDWPRGHRRVTRDNGAIPGRFAIDWVAVDGAGRTTNGHANRPADTLGYAAPVLAGADAVVAAVRDGMAEHPDIVGNPAHPLEDAAGNYVALRLHDGRHVFYEHLKTGSIGVRLGQGVARGMPIGALGFTGDSTGPHLHMHVAAGPDPIRDEGAPFVISDFVELGRYITLDTLGRKRWTDAPPKRRVRAWPGSNVVVRFASSSANEQSRIDAPSAKPGS